MNTVQTREAVKREILKKEPKKASLIQRLVRFLFHVNAQDYPKIPV
jgi:hypothetical protein